MSDVSHRVLLDGQREHWQEILTATPDRFGADPSAPAAAAEVFGAASVTRVLELGAGQGRDTLFFAQAGLQVVALDYTYSALEVIRAKAAARGLGASVHTVRHDARAPLPFPDESFDACYSHMLYCMAFTEAELTLLSAEIRRVLRPGGLNVYTARTTEDPDYGTGVHHGENLYESGGFIVHFLDTDSLQRLAGGFEQVAAERFEEGPLPRRLVRVTLRKSTAGRGPAGA